MIEIERAEPNDRPAIEALLTANHLPLAGLELASELTVVARAGGALVGCAAVEPHGSVGLLRSVCVAGGERGTGLGRRLVAEAEALAVSAGIGELYLLTETVAAWFPRLAYEAAERVTAPSAVASSPEFTGACPDTAIMFRKRLGLAASIA
ncbi:MAG TPA: arsenic resistance N-acetyltransferase ArsN2 [Candidatus Limnocylindrales bacterium]